MSLENADGVQQNFWGEIWYALHIQPIFMDEQKPRGEKIMKQTSEAISHLIRFALNEDLNVNDRDNDFGVDHILRVIEAFVMITDDLENMQTNEMLCETVSTNSYMNECLWEYIRCSIFRNNLIPRSFCSIEKGKKQKMLLSRY